MKKFFLVLVIALIFSSLNVFAAVDMSDFEYAFIDGGVEITSYNGNDLEVVVPSEIDGEAVVSIGYKAFANETMRKVVLPDTVKNISDSAFLNCIFLEEVNIPEGIEQIKYATFKGCTLLRVIQLPSSIEKIDDEAFCNCSSLQTVGVIPSGVTYIGENAFFKCISITSFEVSEENENYESVDGVIYTDNSATLKLYPAGRKGNFSIPENVSLIAEDAFEASSIKEIVIPATVKEIAYNAFHLSSLEDVVFEGDIILSHYAFLECVELKRAVFKGSVQFGYGVFDLCEKATIYAKRADEILDYASENDLYIGYVDGDKLSRPFQRPKINWSAVIGCSVGIVLVVGGFILFRLFGRNRDSQKLINK